MTNITVFRSSETLRIIKRVQILSIKIRNCREKIRSRIPSKDFC